MENLRSVTVSIAVDTNKQTRSEELRLHSDAEFKERVCAALDELTECGASRVWWESLGDDPLTPDEALALAAGLIRAAMEAKL